MLLVRTPAPGYTRPAQPAVVALQETQPPRLRPCLAVEHARHRLVAVHVALGRVYADGIAAPPRRAGQAGRAADE
ncbi:MAG: hypothetical protein ACKO4U_20910, partial [Caldilinea sp.]